MEFKNDIVTVLNYQGSKKQLLEFIFNNVIKYADPNKAILDIFAGTSSVGYSMKRYFRIFANDVEPYAYNIAKALLLNNTVLNYNVIKEMIHSNFEMNLLRLERYFSEYLSAESRALEDSDAEALCDLYNRYPCIWRSDIKFNILGSKYKTIIDLRIKANDIPYCLFTTYYANSYYGINQSMEIDSIRYAIEKVPDKLLKSVLLTALYYAMKECVFSKDGHMAQPLNLEKYKTRLIKVRGKSIWQNFFTKIQDLCSLGFVTNNFENRCFNKNFLDLIKKPEIASEVGLIYADPPYTDMQYSRYYHLLNVVTKYDYPEMTITKGGLSSGLYTEGRFQSNISKKSTALGEINTLFEFCKNRKICIILSFGYPQDCENQASDRYTMNISSLIDAAQNIFGRANTIIETEKYQHSNNRNSQSKKVLEYLIIGKA